MARWRNRRICGTLALLGVLLCERPAGWGQISAAGPLSQGATSNRPVRNPNEDEMDSMHVGLPHSYARMQNTERQRKLVSDTERLLSLTNQLKASIAESGSDSLTPDMLRQMDEIEKLARSVKNKMKN